MLTEYITPGNSLSDIQRRMNRFLSEWSPEFHSTWPFNSFSNALPASNVWENNEAYYIEMAAPGISEDQVSLSMVGNELTIQLKRPEFDELRNNGKYWQQERIRQSSSMSLSLQDSVDSNDITANLDNGVLLIRIPKSEKTQVRKISVNSKS